MTADPTKISAQPPPIPKPEPKNGAAKDVPETSKGEVLFDSLAYGGFAGAVTFLLSLPAGYWVRYSNSGRQAVKWAAGHLKKVGLSEHSSEDAVMTTALMQGGNLMLLPIKFMEDRKPELVAKLNKHVGDETCDLSVDKEPKQTWGSLLKARIFLAWTPVFLSFRTAVSLGGKEQFNAFEEKFAKHLICRPLGQPTHVKGAETTLYKLGRIAALDVFATTAAAALLYVGSRIFAKDNEEKWYTRLKHKLNGRHKTEVAVAPAQVEAVSSCDPPEPVPVPAPETREVKHTRRFNPADSHLQRAQQSLDSTSAALHPQ